MSQDPSAPRPASVIWAMATSFLKSLGLQMVAGLGLAAASNAWLHGYAYWPTVLIVMTLVESLAIGVWLGLASAKAAALAHAANCEDPTEMLADLLPGAAGRALRTSKSPTMRKARDILAEGLREVASEQVRRARWLQVGGLLVAAILAAAQVYAVLRFATPL